MTARRIGGRRRSRCFLWPRSRPPIFRYFEFNEDRPATRGPIDAPVLRSGRRCAMIHPDTRLAAIDVVVGDGVIATRPIPQGTITWVLDQLDGVFTESEVEGLPACYEPLIDRWTFNDGHGRCVLCWDLGRLMNHSCEPNCGG